MIQGVFFDLDGTLADTAPDLGGALNRLLEQQRRSPLPLAALRPHVSGGARALLRVGFGINPDDASYPDYLERFLGIYQAHICDESTLFEGMDHVLNALEARHLPWGIVTNKAERFTLPLVERLALAPRAASVVAGDTAARPKPAPDPLLLACERAGVDPTACIYIGDDLRDIESGRAAGMTTVAAAWGYLGSGPAIDAWGADHILRQPREILALPGL